MISVWEMAIRPFTALRLCELPIHLIIILLLLHIILQLLHIGSRSGLLLILLRQRKQQTVAPLSYILTLPLLKRLLNRVNVLSPRIHFMGPILKALSGKRLQLADILVLIWVVLIGCIKMMFIHFGKGLIHLSKFDQILVDVVWLWAVLAHVMSVLRVLALHL